MMIHITNKTMIDNGSIPVRALDEKFVAEFFALKSEMNVLRGKIETLEQSQN